jgi:hypothetical protein
MRYALLLLLALSLAGCKGRDSGSFPEPELVARIDIPGAFLIESKSRGMTYRYGGDIRIGNLDDDGIVDFLVFRSAENGMKPCFAGAWNRRGQILWSAGEGGTQPRRPGPAVLYDTDGDGRDEVIALFADATRPAVKGSMENVLVQIRNGATGAIVRERIPEEFLRLGGRSPAWLHQRILVANLRGTKRPADFVIKLGNHVLAMDDSLNLLWIHEIPWKDYGESSAYIPAVGDMDGDGRDETTGGVYLLAPDGRVLWQKMLSPHMDSVAIAPWDNGNVRVIGSGAGHVVDRNGNVILALGAQAVPHGQEVRVADFRAQSPGPEMILRHRGHQPDVLLAGNDGKVLSSFRLNDSPNNTGLETVYWNGPAQPALLYNGGMLWAPDGSRSVALSELGPPIGPEKTGWYRCIPADVYGDDREELIVFNPWDTAIYVFSQPQDNGSFKTYRPGPRQYNARLMD